MVAPPDEIGDAEAAPTTRVEKSTHSASQRRPLPGQIIRTETAGSSHPAAGHLEEEEAAL
jgi:hypothetical protein